MIRRLSSVVEAIRWSIPGNKRGFGVIRWHTDTSLGWWMMSGVSVMLWPATGRRAERRGLSIAPEGRPLRFTAGYHNEPDPSAAYLHSIHYRVPTAVIDNVIQPLRNWHLTQTQTCALTAHRATLWQPDGFISCGCCSCFSIYYH